MEPDGEALGCGPSYSEFDPRHIPHTNVVKWQTRSLEVAVPEKGVEVQLLSFVPDALVAQLDRAIPF